MEREKGERKAEVSGGRGGDWQGGRKWMFLVTGGNPLRSDQRGRDASWPGRFSPSRLCLLFYDTTSFSPQNEYHPSRQSVEGNYILLKLTFFFKDTAIFSSEVAVSGIIIRFISVRCIDLRCEDSSKLNMRELKS